MKKIKIIFGFLAVLAITPWAISCSDGEEIIPRNIVVSVTEVSMPHATTKVFSTEKTIEITPVNISSFDIVPSATWLSMEKDSDNKYIIKVEDNPDFYREGYITLTSKELTHEVSIAVNQMGDLDEAFHTEMVGGELVAHESGVFLFYMDDELYQREVTIFGRTEPQSLASFQVLPGVYEIGENKQAPPGYLYQGTVNYTFFYSPPHDAKYTEPMGFDLYELFSMQEGYMSVDIKSNGWYEVEADFLGWTTRLGSLAFNGRTLERRTYKMFAPIEVTPMTPWWE